MTRAATGTERASEAAAPRSRAVVLLAGAALLLAAGVGAFLVFQPDAATSSGAVQRLADVLVDLGVHPRYRAADAVEFSLNVALFVPGAFAAALLWPRVRWRQWVLVGFAVTAAIEAVQGGFLPGRLAEVSDLVANTLGAALGAGLAVVVRRAAPAGPRRR